MNSLNGVMVVGLTGQTGAGKSTVSRLFAESGFCVIDADQIARAVVHKGSRCLLELTECFSDILLPNGELNRKVLAKQAFQNKKNLELMNSIMYPYIMGEILRQIHHHSRMGQKLILLDAPTLFDCKSRTAESTDFAAGFDYRRSSTGSHGCPVTGAVLCRTFGFYHQKQ